MHFTTSDIRNIIIIIKQTNHDNITSLTLSKLSLTQDQQQTLTKLQTKFGSSLCDELNHYKNMYNEMKMGGGILSKLAYPAIAVGSLLAGPEIAGLYIMNSVRGYIASMTVDNMIGIFGKKIHVDRVFVNMLSNKKYGNTMKIVALADKSNQIDYKQYLRTKNTTLKHRLVTRTNNIVNLLKKHGLHNPLLDAYKKDLHTYYRL